MSKNILKLTNPIMIDNQSVSELSYDYTEITNDLYLEAAMRSSAIGNTVNASALREMNEALNLCLGKAAIIAANPKITWEDLGRIKGFDLLSVSNIGRFFITRKAEESAEAPSAKQSEATASDSTPQSETSAE